MTKGPPSDPARATIIEMPCPAAVASPKPFDTIAEVPWPNQWTLTDLSDLKRHRTVRRATPSSEPDQTAAFTRRLVFQFVHVVEKAVWEYEQARAACVRLASKPGGASFQRVVWHLETCFNSIRRAYNCLGRLKGREDAPTVERGRRRFLARDSSTVKELRNTIEHIDEIIARGGLYRGQPSGPMFSEDGTRLEVGPHAIRIADLVSILRTLSLIADDWSTPR
jgi:hypothetical protein